MQAAGAGLSEHPHAERWAFGALSVGIPMNVKDPHAPW